MNAPAVCAEIRERTHQHTHRERERVSEFRAGGAQHRGTARAGGDTRERGGRKCFIPTQEAACELRECVRASCV